MALTAGNRLGAYEIVGTLGEGGMGEVYRALDTTLGREVALKVLPAAVTQDAERVARFRREAQLLASLNHPHIAAIHSVAETDGVTALVLELVEGPTLADRIAQSALPLEEARAIARQIADALEAAHERGVIHRDLKPANIKVRPDGTVKVLDFGLAKALHGRAELSGTAGGASRRPLDSPTITSPAMTHAGVILGTAAYMSPEQAAGKEVDRRADLWAFGAVLFEMLTGTAPFTGETVTHVLAAVLRGEPDWNALPANIPAAIRRLLRRCLAKDPRVRLHDIGDARLELDERIEDRADTLAAPPTRSSRWRQFALPLLTLVIGAVAATALRTRPIPPAPAVARLMLAPTGAAALTVSGNSRDLAITPDGSRIVYVGGNGSALLVRTLDQIEPVRIYEGGFPHQPFISPDGAWVGFRDGIRKLRRVPIAGGPAETICQLTLFTASSFSWGDGTIVFPGGGSLMKVPATSGVPQIFASPDPQAGEQSYFDPAFLPGGRGILHSVVFAGGGRGLAFRDLQTGEKKIVLREGYDARYLPSGHLLFRIANTLRIVRFDLAKHETIGAPVTMTDPILFTPFTATPDFDVSDKGTLVYVPATTQVATRRLVWVGRDGREEPVDLPVRAYTYPSISPDGTQAAFDIRDQENDTWIWNFARHTLRRLTFDPGFDQYAVWTPDGRRVLNFAAGGLVWRQADGTGSAERLVQSPGVKAPTSFSPDGTRLVFREDSAETGHDVMLLSLETPRKVEPLLHSRFNELNAEISPDGRWIAFESDESGRYEVFVRPFPNVNDGKWQVSAGGGTKPLWARNGSELFYVAPGGTMMTTAVERGASFTFGTPVKLLDVGRYYLGGAVSIGRTYDMSSDGKRFLMIQPDIGPPNTIMVVLNWHEELNRLVPTR